MICTPLGQRTTARRSSPLVKAVPVDRRRLGPLRLAAALAVLAIVRHGLWRLFVVFEKRRNDLLRVLDELQKWG
jgi:hypothetical protein